MNRVMLSLRVRQQYPDQEPETIRQKTEGTAVKQENGWLVSYDETGEGMEGVHCTILLEPGRVTVTRSGALRSVMVFENGKHTDFSYASAMGTMEMEIETEQLFWSFSGKTGNLDMRYRILVPGGDSGVIDYHLQIK